MKHDFGIFVMTIAQCSMMQTTLFYWVPHLSFCSSASANVSVHYYYVDCLKSSLIITIISVLSSKTTNTTTTEPHFPNSLQFPALTDRSESARSDISGEPSSGAGSSNVICPNKIAKLSLIKCVANNIDVSFSYHQFERQKPITVSKVTLDSLNPPLNPPQ